MIERRTLITGLVALVAAPAIVKAASLMKVAPTEKLRTVTSPYWEYDVMRDKWTQYSRSAAPLTLEDYNERFLKPMAERWAEQARADLEFYKGEQWATIEADGTGSLPKGAREQVRIRLPNDYATHSADAFAYVMTERRGLVHALGVAALAVAAAPVVEQVLQKPVTRRFWK